jgi:hypothetical protein
MNNNTLEMRKERGTTMTADRVEQLKARLKREDEEKEEAFKKRLEEIRESQAPWRAEQEAKKRAEEQERKKLYEGIRQKQENEMKGRAQRTWIAAGGTEGEFEEAWPSLRTEMLKRRTLEDDANARASQRRSGVSSL